MVHDVHINLGEIVVRLNAGNPYVQVLSCRPAVVVAYVVCCPVQSCRQVNVLWYCGVMMLWRDG